MGEVIADTINLTTTTREGDIGEIRITKLMEMS